MTPDLPPPEALYPLAPYRLDRTLAVLRRFPTPGMDTVGDAGASYWRALRAGDGLALARVTQAEADSPLRVEWLAAAGAVEWEAARATLAHILAVDHDPRALYAAAEADPTLAAVIAPLIGARPLRAASVFEALLTLIIEQHIAWTAALKATRVLLEWGGARLSHAGRDHDAFPSPAQLAAASPAELRPLKITDGRIARMIAIGEATASGALDLEALRDLPPADAYARLLAIPGVGEWTAANTLARALGVFIHVPRGDVALQRAANHYFHGVDGRLTPAALGALFARYGDHGPEAAHHTLLRWVLDRY